MRVYVHIKTNSSPAGVIAEEKLPAERFGVFMSKCELLSALKVAVSSAPVDGQANEELIKIISKHFAVPKSKISITHGSKGRYKTLDITN